MDSWGTSDVFRWIVKCFKWLFKGVFMSVEFLEKRSAKKASNHLTKKKTSIAKIVFITMLGIGASNIILGLIAQGLNPLSVENSHVEVNNIKLVLYFIVFFLQLPAYVGWIIYAILQVRKLQRYKNITVNDLTAPFELFSNTLHGVVFGRKDNNYIIKPESLDGHVLVVGGVGSGKSSCIAIPSLRGWNESVFAIDIKGELYEKTKDSRPNIKVFNPLDENAYGYDPYIFLHTSQNPSQEARAIAQAIVPLPHEVKDPFWIENAQNIFTGAILHYSGEGKTFIETIEAIQSTPPRILINEIAESGTIEARYCVNSLVGIEDKTLSSILAELSRNIVVFVTDRNLRSALSRQNNITPDDLEFGNDVYINIPEHLLRQWKNLLTLIVNQFLTHFEQRTESNARPILFLLDEFPRLGKVSAMLDGLATLRSKKIAMCLVVQSLAQLDAIYGHNERKVISDTCAYKAILGATDADTQEYFSRLVGTYDKTMTAKSRQAYTGLGTNDTTTEQEKRIIKPEEFGRLRDIVLLTPQGFFRVDKAPYYEEE